MDLDAGSGRFSGDGRVGQKLDKMDVLDEIDISGVLDILDVLDVLDENKDDADPGPDSGPDAGPDSGPVLDLDKSEPGLEAGPEKVLDWEIGRFWDKLGVLDENWEMDELDKFGMTG